MKIACDHSESSDRIVFIICTSQIHISIKMFFLIIIHDNIAVRLYLLTQLIFVAYVVFDSPLIEKDNEYHKHVDIHL